MDNTNFLNDALLMFLWPPNKAGHYILQLCFLSSSIFFFFPRLISAVADWMPTILPHMMRP